MSADLLERLQAALADRYAVESEIGRGGMATVFLAEDLKHDRKVAIKVLHPELSVTLAAERFLSEIKIVAGLNHPHILTLHDSGEADGLLYYVMPFVPGESLRHRLEREGQLPVEEAVRIAVEVADGLDFAHRQGVIHRDVKPGNILLSDRHAVITDFGIARAITVAQGARVTSTGLGVGTPLYASPEQATGAETLDGRTDVYSLGCVLYEMLSGEVPLAAPTPHAVQARRLTETPGPIHPMRDTVPPLLDQVIAKSLARLPADRWDSAAKFGHALMTATMDATPVARLDLATTPGLEAITAGVGKRKPLRWVIGAGVFTVAAIGAWLVVPRVVSLSDGGEQAVAPAGDAGPAETTIPLEGRFGARLTFGSGSFAISPNGTHLAYCSYDVEADAGRLRLADLSDPERGHRVLASTDDDCTWVRWSPKGNRILFAATLQGRYDYYEVSTTEWEAAKPFTNCSWRDPTGTYELDPRIAILSPDESRTVYGLDHEAAGYGLRIVPTGSCDFAAGDSIYTEARVIPEAWSPRGDRLLYWVIPAPDNLWTMRTDGSDPQQAHSRANRFPAWPASDEAIWFLSSGRVMRVPVSESGELRGEPQTVFRDEEDPVRVYSVSADGRRMVTARRADRAQIVRVVTGSSGAPMSAMVVPVTDLLEELGAFNLSHDGIWVAYAQHAEYGTDLFKASLDGGAPTRLTRSGLASRGWWSVWSPDDQLIAYPAVWQDSLVLGLVSADGKRSGRVLDVTPNLENPTLSWEAGDLLYHRHDYRAGQLKELEIEYGQWVGAQWTPGPPESAPGATFVARGRQDIVLDTLRVTWSDWAIASPRGDRVAVHATLADLGEYWVTISTTDSVLTPLAPASGEQLLGWSEDGQSLYWQQGSDLYRSDSDAGDRELLLTLPVLPDGQVWRSPCRPRPGVEPLEFVCAIDESVTELFLVENLNPGAD